MWINISGNGARSDDNVRSKFRGNWNKVDKDKWAKFGGFFWHCGMRKG